MLAILLLLCGWKGIMAGAQARVGERRGGGEEGRSKVLRGGFAGGAGETAGSCSGLQEKRAH